MTLPIRRVTFYKHGLGFFERHGHYEGRELRLEFPRAAMDDILKSLVAISQSGQVWGLEFETPPDRNPGVSRRPLELSAEHGLTDLLAAFRGRRVRVRAGSETLEGQLAGSELEEQDHLKRGKLSLYLPDEKTLRVLELGQVERVDLLDERASGDLEFFLTTKATDEERSGATLRLSEGAHDLTVSYIAPAPAWRVSYRLLATEKSGGEGPGASDILLQGWGLFDNTLGEDLENVELSLMAGMPVSFRYALHRPNTPERPLVQDEERTVEAPILFDAMPPMAAMAAPMPRVAFANDAEFENMAMPKLRAAAKLAKDLEQSSPAAAAGAERGALFAYRIAHPVSVRRGQSAMVPIVGQRLEGRRELLFNERKQAKNPVASLRFKNATGLSLERGPVTVLEDADYAGEAVLDFSPAGAEVIVSYAVELGVQVRTQTRGETRTARLSLQPGYLVVEEHHIQTTAYEIHNNTAKPCEVVVEHNRSHSYDLFETPEPVESTQALARWRVPCPAGQKTVFTVAERALNSRSEAIGDLDLRALERYLRDKYLDQATFDRLEGLLNLYGQMQDLEDRGEKLEAERQKIYSRQTQIQGNLAPLGSGGEEGRLRTRLVGELSKLEDALGELEAAEATIGGELEGLEGQIEAALGNLGA